MIKRSRLTILAVATVLSVGVATQLNEKDTQPGAEVRGLQHCALELANCRPIVLAAAKDDDWTAWGGAMRGVEK